MKVLYISYDGLLDPLGYSQIAPYLIDLSKKGVHFSLLSFEKRQNLRNKDELSRIKGIFNAGNIKWKMLYYHKTPSLVATSLDVFQGIINGLIIILRDGIRIIHARSFVGAIPGLWLARLFNLRFIFDMRGFWPEERVEGNIWPRKGLLYKISKWHEKQFLANADRIVCLTWKAKKIIEELPYLKDRIVPIDVIPTCVDLTKFGVRPKDETLLKRLNLRNRFTFLYFGSIGSWYMLEEMIDFFKTVKRVKPASFFLFLTPNKDLVQEKMDKGEIAPEDFFVDFVPYEEIPHWLSIADSAILFIRPTYSKKSSCPTKLAESLACGLPVITNSDIGDTEEIIKRERVGAVIENFNEDLYRKAAGDLLGLLEEGSKLRERCRATAIKYFSLQDGANKYLQIYRETLNLHCLKKEQSKR